MKIFEKLGGATKILRNFFGGALKISEILGGAPKNLGILKNSIQPDLASPNKITVRTAFWFQFLLYFSQNEPQSLSVVSIS